jgi:Na+/H+ antiporter NhaC
MREIYKLLFISILVFCFALIYPGQINAQNLTEYDLDRIDYTESENGIVLKGNQDGIMRFSINGTDQKIQFSNGQGKLILDVDHKGKIFFLQTPNGKHSLLHAAQKSDGSLRIKHIPLWLSILPPLIAIFLALIFKEVVVSLFMGIFTGAFIIGGMRIESLYYFILSIVEPVSVFVIEALTDSGHLSVIIFSLMIGGMVAIISKNGGMAGVVLSLSRYAKSKRSSQFITWLLGVAIFFDDYANILIVGNTMRNVTDRFKISREKLAYIVDSTAAPVSAVAFVTTWIGAELGYIDSGMETVGGPLGDLTPYAIFVSSLKYSFYPILTLIFILILIYTGKDYGTMYTAEVRAGSTGQVSSASTPEADEPNMENLDPVPGAKLRWHNAVIPVLTVIGMTIFGLVDTGMSSLYEELVSSGSNVTNSYGSIWSQIGVLLPGGEGGFFMKLGKLIGGADSYTALLWASFSGLTVAIALTVGGKIIRLFDTMHYMTVGFKTMMPALIILTLAWALAATTNELHTADYITSLLADSVSPYFMPGIIFILSAFIAFSTGSSWSTMAILYPIAIPTTWAVCVANGIDPATGSEILLNVIATVLAASVLGDHCSPISDTTILSSLAADCNHIDHVRTQLPYALTVGSTCLIIGTISTYLGGGWLISFGLVSLGTILFFIIIKRFGKKSDDPVEFS